MINFSLAIIGAGNIGLRHYQGALKSKNLSSIYIVDPDPYSIKKIDKGKLKRIFVQAIKLSNHG